MTAAVEDSLKNKIVWVGQPIEEKLYSLSLAFGADNRSRTVSLIFSTSRDGKDVDSYMLLTISIGMPS